MAIRVIAKRPAPEFTPIMLGDAIWLFSTACIIVPDTARALPASTAEKTRGRRINKSIFLSEGDMLFVKKFMFTEPKEIAIMTAVISITVIIAITKAFLLKCFRVDDFCKIFIAFIPSVIGFVVEEFLW